MTDDRRSGYEVWSGACIVVLALLLPTAAVSQTTTQNLADDSGAPDFFRPPPNMFQTMYEYKTAPGSRHPRQFR
jgi:hypothetical protein